MNRVISTPKTTLDEEVVSFVIALESGIKFHHHTTTEQPVLLPAFTAATAVSLPLS
jgi:hypothetical protein